MSRITPLLTALTLCLTAALPAPAQQSPTPPKEGSTWQRVQALPPGQKLEVITPSHKIHCILVGATADSLTCTSGKHNAEHNELSRLQIQSVRIVRRGRSALIGAGIGGAALGITGFAVATDPKDSFFGPNFLRGPITAVGVLLGGAIGAGIGAGTDFAHSTVYKAP